MIHSILVKLGLLKPRGGEAVTTIRLDIIAEQVKEFNEAKRQINDKIHNLESKTDSLGETVSKTLEMGRENKKRLDSIEESMQKLVDLSAALLREGEPNEGILKMGSPPADAIGKSSGSQQHQ
ncbi:MAG: hypothetical protein V1744_07620 [Candidatus Altiarchaeota archaeon]